MKETRYKKLYSFDDAFWPLGKGPKVRILLIQASILFKKAIKAKRIKVNTVTEKQCKNCADFDVTFLPLGKGQKVRIFVFHV